MKILAANRLVNGEAVWLAGEHRWSDSIHGAELAHDKEAEERLAQLGKAAFLANEVIDVELIDVELVEGGIRPLRLRERIRAAGPTIRADLGKQARPAVPQAA